MCAPAALEAAADGQCNLTGPTTTHGARLLGIRRQRGVIVTNSAWTWAANPPSSQRWTKPQLEQQPVLRRKSLPYLGEHNGLLAAGCAMRSRGPCGLPSTPRCRLDHARLWCSLLFGHAGTQAAGVGMYGTLRTGLAKRIDASMDRASWPVQAAPICLPEQGARRT